MNMNNWRQTFSWKVPFIHHKDVIDQGFHWQGDPATDDSAEVPVKQGERITRNWDDVNCPICLAERAEATMYKEHNKEARRRRAEFYNYGWASGDYFIHSKTSRGRLYTEIDPDTFEVTHDWDE